MIKIESGLLSGAGEVARLEVETQEFALPLDEIRPYYTENTKFVLLAKVSSTLVGYILLSFDRVKKIAYIDRIGTQAKFRRKGVATALVDYAEKFAKREDIPQLQILVPNYLVDDKEDPWCVETWLWKTQFQAVGVAEEPCVRYGKEYDFYIFERMKLCDVLSV